jgi:putative PIN family toxin of toxin-antitoxin system
MPQAFVVIDTNILVSAHLNPRGLENRVNNLANDGVLWRFVTAEILAEYELVLRRPKFPFQPAKIEESLVLIRRNSTLVSPSRTLSISPDERDNRFLEFAETAHADYLVTGNRRHFPLHWGNTRIVSARELLESVFAC